MIAHARKQAGFVSAQTAVFGRRDDRGRNRGVALCSGTSGLSQSAATVIAIAKMSVGSPPTDFKFARTGQAGPGKWAAVRVADADNYYVVRANALEDVDTFMAAIHWENTDRLFSELTNERGAQPGDKPT